MSLLLLPVEGESEAPAEPITAQEIRLVAVDQDRVGRELAGQEARALRLPEQGDRQSLEQGALPDLGFLPCPWDHLALLERGSR